MSLQGLDTLSIIHSPACVVAKYIHTFIITGFYVCFFFIVLFLFLSLLQSNLFLKLPVSSQAVKSISRSGISTVFHKLEQRKNWQCITTVKFSLFYKTFALWAYLCVYMHVIMHAYAHIDYMQIHNAFLTMVVVQKCSRGFLRRIKILNSNYTFHKHILYSTNAGYIHSINIYFLLL